MMETVPSGTILYGRYRIERALGSGGFGHVYLATDLRTNQLYALKEYLVTGASGQAQLQHEARVLSQLHHPNLPAFHEAFNERGRYYVVLSYIEGNDLTDLIRVTRQRNEAIPLPRIMEWVLAVCDAVAFLHSQQPPVIHRDIKPDNIRITPNRTAILVDLGNAKAAASGERTLFFIRHQGTPGYAPQEQYPGGSGTDARSDVYALGGTLYFALTAHEPPSVSTRNQSIQHGQPDLPSLQEQLAKNPPEQGTDPNTARQFRVSANRPPKPMSKHVRHLAQLGTLPLDLLNQLNNIIRRAMAMNPKERYQSVTEFSNDLRRIVAVLPSAVPPQIPARQGDPHSTQPDLPMLFDTIQAAKAVAEQASQAPTIPGRSQNPPQPGPQAPSSPIASYSCPRCGAPLLPQASFCPRCGTSLSQPTIPGNSPSLPTGTGTPPPDQNKPQPHNMSTEQTLVISPPRQAPAGQDSSNEQTIMITPQVQMQQPPSYPTKPVIPSQNGNRVPPVALSPQNELAPAQYRGTSGTPTLPPTPLAQHPSAQAGYTQAPSLSAVRTNAPPTRSSSARSHKMLLTFCIVLVVLLLAVILVFALLASRHTAHVGQLASIQRLSVEVQVMYGRTLSIGAAPFALARLRKTGPIE